MIYGIGHDVVEIERIRHMLDSSAGDKFAWRILTSAEYELPGRIKRSAEFLAGRFAAKEAVSKAFGCGIGKVLGFRDIEVIPDASGKPSVYLQPEAWQRLGLSGPDSYAVHISITHERQLASAFAVVERMG
ncbi:holo-ACP synthase [Paenibacillus sp. D2_2]|uniref:holo-ACP synthase n=1 Tax=Paenibacillus sp. D2_2 TaxID=3073092 RepID=UPI0028164256|nr:holo-ACP synthase [Paenibacillus sp. D2_2]WMT43389.1 holo-ACP synthase [Paenibacillus sp. D2_2]